MNAGVPRNQFDLSHDVKLSLNMGELVPTLVLDVVPGDKFKISAQNMLRFAPLISPVMHRVKVNQHYFFVPNRIIWPEWGKWISGETDVEPPIFKNTFDADTGTLADYLGFPIGAPDQLLEYNALPVAAYAKIYDEYYRDQNLQAELFVPLVPGDNPDLTDLAYGPPLKRAWEHDYFTSALPFAQKGDEVTLPLTNGETADVTLKTDSTDNAELIRTATGGIQAGDLASNATGQLVAGGTTSTLGMQIDPNNTLEVDLNAEAASINTLRRAFRLQEWLEKNARAGTRYIELIKSHFGVKSSDARLNRPEYIGGSTQNMVISEVLSTAQTVDQASNDVPVGQMAGHGISVGGGKNFSYKAEEHGFILGMMSVMPETAYQQGLPRMLNRPDRLDYYWPSFANIGEQAIQNKELYVAPANGSGDDPEGTFGYIPRYSEYKFVNSRVAGDMKGNLSYWHLGRIFTSLPPLNADFIECVPSKRIFAVTEENEDSIYAHVYNKITAIRPMPKYGVPTI